MRQVDRDRGTATERGYDWAWTKASKGFLAHHPLCVGCAALGLVVAAELVDHIEPHKGNKLKFWDKANWQPCCRWHHDVVKQKLERMWLSGSINVLSLRLDSDAAIGLSRRLR